MADDKEIIRSLGRLEGKCDSIISSLKDHTERMNRIDQDIEDLRDLTFRKNSGQGKRIAALEKKQYGIFLIGGILGSIALTILKIFL